MKRHPTGPRPVRPRLNTLLLVGLAFCLLCWLALIGGIGGLAG
jgi:hypothetical protein